MKPTKTDVELVDRIVSGARLHCKNHRIQSRRLNLDCYEFEVSKKRVKDGIALYYTEGPTRVQADADVWYSNDPLPISTKRQGWQQQLPAYLKLLMGQKDWYKEKHHLRMIGEARPNGFFGARLVREDVPYALFFRLPRGTRIFDCNPQPIEFSAQDDRLNMLFILVSQSPEPQPRNLDISYEIPIE
jgi:hypothetical protein